MGKAIVLRADHGADDLRRLARASRDAARTRRLLALAAICDGASRTEAARVGCVGLQIVRDWVMRFNAEAPTGLLDPPPGKPSLLKLEQRAALAKAVEVGAKPELHGVVRRRLGDLVGWLRDTSSLAQPADARARAAPDGFRKLSACPRDHAQNPEALEAFKKTFPPSWRRSAPSCPRRPPSSSGGRSSPWKPVDVYVDGPRPMADARVGQKNGITRRSASCAARPAHHVGLHFRRDLPRRRARPPAL